jgi:hypothetical protein
MSLRDVAPESIEARLQELRLLGDQYAKAHARATAIEEGKKSKLAQLMKKYEREGHKTAAAQEREALADPEYQVLLEGLEAAVFDRERLRWQFKLAELSVGVWQTLQANRRSEQRAYGA